MVELDGADPETVNRIAWRRGSLPVRLAMLGLASVRKGEGPLWWGYPPGVFISYKWAGDEMRRVVADFAAHIRGLGYRVYLDAENLDREADAYFQIPQFITSLQDCAFYLLLLTDGSVRSITASDGTTWIHDEFQHAMRLLASGRLIVVPVLLEPVPLPDFFTAQQVLDLTAEPRALEKLSGILTPRPLLLDPEEVVELRAVVSAFDRLLLGQEWMEAAAVLERSARLGATFDHQFRRMLHGLYTADEAAFTAAFGELCEVYGQAIVLHIYRGYCAEHGIPVRLSERSG